jgi:hypothetical protein
MSSEDLRDSPETQLLSEEVEEPKNPTDGSMLEALQTILVVPDSLKSAVEFVHTLEPPDARGSAFSALYEQVQLQQLSGAPEMLLLQKRMQETPTCDPAVRTRVAQDCERIVQRLVEGVAAGGDAFSLGADPEALDAAMPEVVRRAFGGGSLQETLLLVQFSTRLPLVSSSCSVVAALLEQLRRRQLMRSEHALHLWAHAKYYADHATCRELEENSEELLEHYRRYVEHPDRSVIQRLHRANWHLQAIVTDFLAFYFNGELKRSQHLLAAAKAVSKYLAIGRILG